MVSHRTWILKCIEMLHSDASCHTIGTRPLSSTDSPLLCCWAHNAAHCIVKTNELLHPAPGRYISCTQLLAKKWRAWTFEGFEKAKVFWSLMISSSSVSSDSMDNIPRSVSPDPVEKPHFQRWPKRFGDGSHQPAMLEYLADHGLLAHNHITPWWTNAQFDIG